MIWGKAGSSRRDGGERGRLYRISGARQLPCMAAGGKKRATTAVRVRGGVDDFPRGCEGAGICRLLLRCSCVVAGGAALPYRRGVGAGETVSFAQRRMEGDVPAVSNARRLVDRLQGGQHCRRALEIRSEVSAPALMVPRYLGSVREVSSLLFSGSGGLGLRLEALGNSRCSCPVRACARLNRVPCSSLSGFKLRRALPAPA